MTYELAVLFTKWAQLYTDRFYAAMDFDAFKQHNIETFFFDNAAWRSECLDAEDQSTTPVQRVNPPNKASATPAPTAGYKCGRGVQPAVGHQGVKRKRPQQ